MTRYSPTPSPQYGQVKYVIGQVFKELRREGFIARQSYLCCRGCAGAALDTEENKGKPAVYYTRQDRESFEQCGQVYLGFGVVGGDDEEDVRMAGQAIAQALHQNGLAVEWDESPMTRILVTGFLPPEPEATYLDLVGAVA